MNHLVLDYLFIYFGHITLQLKGMCCSQSRIILHVNCILCLRGSKSTPKKNTLNKAGISWALTKYKGKIQTFFHFQGNSVREKEKCQPCVNGIKKTERNR